MNGFLTKIVSFSADLAIENLKQFKSNEKKLQKILQKKVKSNQRQDNNELDEYFNLVCKINNDNIDYIDTYTKGNLLIDNSKKDVIIKLSNLYNKRLDLEIQGEKRKSAEVSINILYNTHNAINSKIREYEQQQKTILESDNKNGVGNFEMFTIPVENKENIKIEYIK